MIQTLIGRKIDQTQKFLEDGKRVPVTLISVGDNAVLQVKTQDKDAYTAVQLGFGTKKNSTKAMSGHTKKAGFEKVSAVIREVRIANDDASASSAQDLPAAGELIAVDAVFKPGDVVSVTGISKGKGWAGVVKRHNFKGGPKTHGQSDRLRAPGSIGQTTTPGRVYKGKRMAGRMGSDQVTSPNLTVLGVDTENKILLVTGLVAGHKNAIVTVTKTGERKKFLELIEEKVKREALEAAEAEKARIEAEKAAKIAEEEAAKVEAAAAAQAAEAPVATAEETVVDATETVTTPEEAATKEDASASSAQEQVEEKSSAAEAIEDKAEEVAVNEEVKETEEAKAEEAESAEKAEEKEEVEIAAEVEEKEEAKS